MQRYGCGFVATAAITVAIHCSALAQPAANFPTKPIRLVIAQPPGGSVDINTRLFAHKMSETLGQQVIVDNRGGGSGLVGTRAVLKSAPDGYTLLLGHTGTISITPSLYANAGFDPRKDFTAIGLIASMPVVLIAHPSFPAKSIGEAVGLVPWFMSTLMPPPQMPSEPPRITNWSR